MFPFLLLFLLLADGSAIGEEAHFPEAVEVFRCDFDASTDKDFDTWPDGWTRQRGNGFPNYMKIHIQRESSPGGENCLRVDLDGGGAAIFSPPIPININYGYLLEAYIRTEALKHDSAFLTMTFLDAEKHTISISQSDAITESNGWKKVRLGTIESSNLDARWIVVGLHVESRDESDLRGAVSFSGVWLGRLPRMDMKTNHPHNFFVLPDKAKVTCTASGMDERFSEATFELFDVLGESLAKETRQLTPQLTDADQSRDAEVAAKSAPSVVTSDWTPPISGSGFYRIRFGLKGSVETADRRDITLVVVEPHLPPQHGVFGWSLPQDGWPWAIADLPYLLEQTGNSWVKYPLWCLEKDGGRKVEQIIQFAEKLNDKGIQVAGMLLDPPPPVHEQFVGKDLLTAADIFDADPKIWYSSLEPVIIQLSNKVRYWQLGSDTDRSMLILPNFIEKLKNIRANFDSSMQGLLLGIGWNWQENLPSGTGAELPLDFISLSSEAEPTSRELGTYLDADRDSPMKRWVVLAPLPFGEQPLQTRAEDLVARMVAAKIHGADAVFCPDPFDRKHGLMNPDGTPGELFFPWRTTALAIGNAQFLGEMVLPKGSRNWVFLRENDAIMYLWNRKPTEEVIYLGEDIEQTTIWGRTSKSLELDHRQLITADRQPSFVAGINKGIAQWSTGLQIKKKYLSSIFGQPLPNSFTVKNTFANTVKGKAVINCPQSWEIQPRETTFLLEPNEELTHQFNIVMTSLATQGRNVIRIDFQIEADRPYSFSVYRAFDVGTGDVHIEVQTKLNEKNELEVEQNFINESEKPVNFRCELTAPDRRRLMTQILRQGHGENSQVYRLEEGKSLIGKSLWIRAEEIDGTRILNYHFEAEE